MKDKTALHFLVAWSLFEAKCAGGRFGTKKLLDSEMYPAFVSHELHLLAEAAAVFHDRYQDQHRLNSLAPPADRVTNVFSRVESILSITVMDLAERDSHFLCAFVASRVRNNMFHGTKKLEDWLRDKPLIERATQVLMLFVSAAERQHPSLIAKAA